MPTLSAWSVYGRVVDVTGEATPSVEIPELPAGSYFGKLTSMTSIEATRDGHR